MSRVDQPGQATVEPPAQSAGMAAKSHGPAARVSQLDFLRALAVLMVILHHNTICALPAKCPQIVRAFSEVSVRVGWMGVDLFFVLSGFLISGLLFREQKKYGLVDFKRFYIRRGLKLYPPFYALLLSTGLAALFSNIGRPVTVGRMIPELLFIQNYVTGIWGHTWSLAVEEHFYITLGVALYFLLRRNAKRADPFAVLPKVFLVVATLILIVRVWKAPYTYCKTHYRLDSLLFGVILSYYYNYHSAAMEAFVRKYKYALIAVAAVLISATGYSGHGGMFTGTVGFSCLYFAFGSTMMVLIIAPPSLGRTAKKAIGLVAAVGAYSYSIYLWHSPFGSVLPLIWKNAFGTNMNWYAFMAIYLPGSFALGILTAKVVEYPFLALRDRLYPSRSSAVQTR